MNKKHDFQDMNKKKCVSDEISTAAEDSQQEAQHPPGRSTVMQRQAEPMSGKHDHIPTILPPPPLRNDAVVGPDDDEAGIQAFDAALVRQANILQQIVPDRLLRTTRVDSISYFSIDTRTILFTMILYQYNIIVFFTLS